MYFFLFRSPPMRTLLCPPRFSRAVTRSLLDPLKAMSSLIEALPVVAPAVAHAMICALESCGLLPGRSDPRLRFNPRCTRRTGHAPRSEPHGRSVGQRTARLRMSKIVQQHLHDVVARQLRSSSGLSTRGTQ